MQRLGFVKRNLKGSPYKHREMAYTSLVRSPMEYCGAIWDPVLKRDVDYKLARVQRQGAQTCQPSRFWRDGPLFYQMSR